MTAKTKILIKTEVIDLDLFLKLKHFIETYKNEDGKKPRQTWVHYKTEEETTPLVKLLMVVINASVPGLLDVKFKIETIELETMNGYRLVVRIDGPGQQLDLRVQVGKDFNIKSYCSGCDKSVYWDEVREQWVDEVKYVTDPEVAQICRVKDGVGHLHKL